MQRTALLLILLSLTSGTGPDPARAQAGEDVKVLIVTAHPDDETMFAASVYKITHMLQGKVDLALITDGSGGFDYAMLAEPLYGRTLAEEAPAREYLPAIRKQELMAGGRIIGLRKYFFLDQLDHMYTLNVDTVLQHVWDTNFVKDRLQHIMMQGDYDYIFTHLPVESTHGHHKGATILALETVRDLPSGRKPVVLGALMIEKDDTTGTAFTSLPGYPVTRVREDVPPLLFDRTQPVESDGLLNYKVIVNWLIAEHKSQGTLQLLVNEGDLERFWFFDLNDPAALPATQRLFERLNQNEFLTDSTP